MAINKPGEITEYLTPDTVEKTEYHSFHILKDVKSFFREQGITEKELSHLKYYLNKYNPLNTRSDGFIRKKDLTFTWYRTDVSEYGGLTDCKLFVIRKIKNEYIVGIFRAKTRKGIWPVYKESSYLPKKFNGRIDYYHPDSRKRIRSGKPVIKREPKQIPSRFEDLEILDY